MRMLRTPPFFPPKRGKNHIWKYFPDSAPIFWIIIYKRQFLHKNKSINPKSVEFHQCHTKRHSIWFDRNVCQDLLTLENTDSHRTWKCTRCIMQMSYLYASDFPFKNFRKLAAQHAESMRKNAWEKSCDAYSLTIRVQTPINHISICFLPQYQRQRKCFFLFRAREERELKKALRDTSTRAA